MALLEDLVGFLDSELKTESIADYPGAMNGLQLANSGRVTRVVAAVDASLAVVKAAASGGPGGLLIVHHGMFWQGVQPVTGAFYEKLKIAIEADLAIYSSHLPLDVHPAWGNNILLAEATGLLNPEPFLERKGMAMGIRGDFHGNLSQLVDVLGKAVAGPVHICPSRGDFVRNVGIITGGAGSEVSKVAAAGIDTFITGEGPHWSYTLAEELGVNLLYAGHYATETFGVKKLTAEIAVAFNLPNEFVDFPTGL